MNSVLEKNERANHLARGLCEFDVEGKLCTCVATYRCGPWQLCTAHTKDSNNESFKGCKRIPRRPKVRKLRRRRWVS